MLLRTKILIGRLTPPYLFMKININTTRFEDLAQGDLFTFAHEIKFMDEILVPERLFSKHIPIIFPMKKVGEATYESFGKDPLYDNRKVKTAKLNKVTGFAYGGTEVYRLEF